MQGSSKSPDGISPERWRRIEELYYSALKLQPEQRSEFLDGQCADDSMLRVEVEALLLHETASHDDFIQAPVFELAAQLLAKQASNPANQAMIGSVVGNFKILEKLGEGGMGVVYKAADLKLPRYVALKFLPEMLSHDPAALERFRREARAASTLNHPNICTIHEIGEHDGKAFIVMELMEGMTLRQRIASGPLKLPEVLAIGMDVANGLAAAHSKGIIHRDIKPANIFVTADVRAKVLDFGLAKVLAAQSKAVAAESTLQLSLTAPGATVGTLAYMSPEQARGEELDARTDLFSFGATLYEMATGVGAFRGKSIAEIHDAILNRQPRSATEINPEVSSLLQEIITKTLCKDPALRFQNAADLSRALRNVGVTVPPLPRPVILTRRMFVQVSSFMLIGVALILTSLRPAWMGSLMSVVRPPAHPIRSIAVLPFKPLVPETRDEALELGMADTLIARLSNSSQLVVRPINSVRRFTAIDQDPFAAGEALGVEAVLEGTIQRSGDRIRVTTRLLKVSDHSTLWSDHFDQNFSDIFGVQDSISERVVENLSLKLTEAENELLRKRYTQNSEAYDLYLKGRFLWDKRTRDSTERARDYFQQALDRDATYALAYAGLADCYRTLPIMADQPSGDAFLKAKQAALQALALDERLGEAHATLAYIKFFYDWDWSGSEKESRRALELNPDYALGHIGYAHLLSNMGRHEEGIQEIDRALEIDRFSLLGAAMKGMFLFDARKYDESAAYLGKELEIEPNFWITQITLGKAYERLGRYEEAIAAFEKAMQLSSGNTEADSLLGYTYAVTGRKAEALRVLRDMKGIGPPRYVPPYNIALIYLGLGDTGGTITWLEKAYAEKDVHLVFLGVEPKWDPIRKDPRFINLFKRLNFPQSKVSLLKNRMAELDSVT